YKNNILLHAIPSYSARRTLFDHFVPTRAEEERKEKRAAYKALIEGYNSYRMRRRRVLALKRSVEEKARAKRAASVSSFKSMLRENKEISKTSRWYKEKLKERERALRKQKE
nr:hypothetical protein [Tanacetum cinerariifolium]GEZ81429.1 hypothetical protein [Tanacetum cinerariifolium]